MVEFEDAPVTDERAQSLLHEYFADRASSFPAEQGQYTVTMPDPARFTPPKGIFILLNDADGSFGCGGARRLRTEPGQPIRYEIKHLWVQPRARRTGAGRALLAELERRAIAFGAQELVLDTNVSLAAAGSLYRTSGYREIAPYNDNPNATTWFAKQL
ncbi:MAG TPA: GNAT family N-acetyltransferase [Microbacteriaceae bacterium]|jgi:ribosomal protein S18 acetylase RimI-like enzyme|nr:GNAT family N-acetyltransferase [Microbacteriaceae bacterium]